MTIEDDGIVGDLDLQATTPIAGIGFTLTGTFKLFVDTSQSEVSIEVSNGTLQFTDSFKIEEGDFSIRVNGSGFKLTVNGKVTMSSLGTFDIDGQLNINGANIDGNLNFKTGTKIQKNGIFTLTGTFVSFRQACLK